GDGGAVLAFRDEQLGSVSDVPEEEAELIADLDQRLRSLLHERQRSPQEGAVPLCGYERLETRDELVDRQTPNPYAVEPIEAVPVEFSAGLLHLIDAETVDEVVHREDLVLRPGGPADEREVVDHRLGQVAVGSELLDLRRAVPLRELLAVRAEHVWELRDRRDVPAERPVDEQMLRRRWQPVLAAKDVRDPHLV